MKIFYKTPKAISTGGRNGRVELEDSTLGFDLEMPDKDATGVNPEKLFAMGYAACFDNAVAHVADKMGLAGATSKTIAEVGMGMNTEGGFVLDIDLHVEVSGTDEANATKLVETSHQVCPYSNAIRGNIEVRLHTTVV